MAARKTAAQKAAEAAEREAYTTYPEDHGEEPDTKDDNLSEVTDEKTGKRLTIQQLKNKLRNEAEREVLDAHKDEVVTITAAKYKKHGLKYVRRLSEAEKAQKTIEDLYAQFPQLRPQVLQQQAQEQDREVAYAPSDYAEHPGVAYIEAERGGALDRFRAGDYDDVTAPEVEAREGE
jgi:hypothetical protein